MKFKIPEDEKKNEPIIIRNPHAVRPWQHVLEPLSGYLLLASRMMEEPGNYCEAWNFGPNDSSMKTVGEVAGLAVKHWGEGSWKNCFDRKWFLGKESYAR